MAGKGKAEGCAACAKWLLIVFNIIFCLLGIGFLVAGAYAFIQLRDYLDFLGQPNVNVPGILLLVFGCITFIIAAIGCIGACKESPCLLFTFAAIIGCLLIAEIVVGAVAFAYRDDLEKKIDEYGPEALQNAEGNDSAEGVRKFWDFVQNNIECCGVKASTDWKEPPASCYTNKDKENGQLIEEGCKDKVIDLLRRNIYAVGGVAVGFGVIELLGIVFACCVGCAARKGEYA